MKCKVITSSRKLLEEDVNDWLSTGRYEITNIVQTESAENGYITITIFYYTEKESRKLKLDKINKYEN